MKPLHEDQIHAPAFQKLCDFIWAPQADDGYIQSVIKEHNPNLKVFNSQIPMTSGSGVIFVGMAQLIEHCLDAMPREGNYIIVHRTNDRSFTQAMYAKKPASVKHIYTVDCAVNERDVSAIPIGIATINGEDELLKKIVNEEVQPAMTKLFCRYNVNPATVERLASLPILKKKPFAKVIEEQIPEDEFYRQIKAHKFTMSLRGCGPDACRTWDAICLGSIPIISECVEMRHFSDLPVIYCPADMNSITDEWLDSQNVSGSTERMRMSYWENHLNQKRKEYGI